MPAWAEIRKRPKSSQLISKRPDLPQPKLTGINHEPEPPLSDLAAKPPQKPAKHQPSTPPRPGPTMDDPDPWNTPDVHKGHAHSTRDAPATPDSDAPNGGPHGAEPQASDGDSFPSMTASTSAAPTRSASGYADAASPTRHAASASQPALPTSSAAGWGGYYETSAQSVGSPGGFGEPVNPFGSNRGLSVGGGASGEPPLLRTASGHTGNALEEVISVILMPEKEGFFLFQHHNYEVTSSRRGSKVVRRYSDFVWLLECLHKRYPFRALPPLPPKRVAGGCLSYAGPRVPLLTSY